MEGEEQSQDSDTVLDAVPADGPGKGRVDRGYCQSGKGSLAAEEGDNTAAPYLASRVTSPEGVLAEDLQQKGVTSGSVKCTAFARLYPSFACGCIACASLHCASISCPDFNAFSSCVPSHAYKPSPCQHVELQGQGASFPTSCVGLLSVPVAGSCYTSLHLTLHLSVSCLFTRQHPVHHEARAYRTRFVCQ